MPTNSISGATLSSILLSVPEAKLLLRGLNTDKAYDRHGLPTRVLVECASEVAPSVTKLFNKSLSRGVLPKLWKEVLYTCAQERGQ